MSMVKLHNLISRILLPPSHPFVDVLRSKCSPVSFEIITEKTFSLFGLLQPVLVRDLVHCFKADSRKVISSNVKSFLRFQK